MRLDDCQTPAIMALELCEQNTDVRYVTLKCLVNEQVLFLLLIQGAHRIVTLEPLEDSTCE